MLHKKSEQAVLTRSKCRLHTMGAGQTRNSHTVQRRYKVQQQTKDKLAAQCNGTGIVGGRVDMIANFRIKQMKRQSGCVCGHVACLLLAILSQLSAVHCTWWCSISHADLGCPVKIVMEGKETRSPGQARGVGGGEDEEAGMTLDMPHREAHLAGLGSGSAPGKREISPERQPLSLPEPPGP